MVAMLLYYILHKNNFHEVVYFSKHNKSQDPTISGINVAANPEVCGHHYVHIMDSCGSVHWTELAQKNSVIGSCEYTQTYSWTFSFVYSLNYVQILKANTISGADTSFIIR
jgi:hypothetical protein